MTAHRQSALGLSLVAALLSAACTTTHSPPLGTEETTEPPGEVLFDGALADIAPHHDGDRRVLRLSGVGSPDGVAVEQLSSGDGAGEFVSTLFIGEAPVARALLRDDGQAVSFVREIDPRQGVALDYSPPLPYISAPLRTGVRRLTASVTLRRLSDGQPITQGRMDYAVSARRLGADAKMGRFEIVTDRRLELQGRVIHQHGQTSIAPGVGEIGSVISGNGGVVTKSELLCARIAGRTVLDCSPEALEALGQPR